ncbi:ACP S-malonyltransferase [Actinosynnema pretiosum subsp. pretiosum]|uniref:[acyl-carrier-protein] S-malonyltransferase n=1 Tax=Actinosynnema pretiosum subsp. pretiosum TaxID=103721 RepID=A0AA45R5E6_9PSEU|nr:Malonyl CoA-acyl carrier protein transacylase [Actinosynnema pretiosum subsp. pretiosum]QUF05749.1 ACP S-malonyltransferase [Actinosynnema pretiosum subsp. pretiosum]
MSVPTAIAFPGMGPVQFADVAKFMLVNPFARELVGVADEVLGVDLFAALRESGSDYSAAAQVGFLVNCLALARWAEHEHGFAPELVTGASFGGKAAAVHSGAISAEEGIWLTAELVRVETEYFAAEHGDVVTLSFARTPQDVLDAALAELDDWHELSCRVDVDFAMVSLKRDKVGWFSDRLRAAGGLPLYEMDPPLHVSLFGGLRDRIERELLSQVTFRDPAVPVVADQDGSVRTTAEGVRAVLLDGVVRTVRWPSVVGTLRERGVERLCVAGQDSLFGRVACTRDNFEVLAATPRLATRPYKRPALV